MPLPVSHKLVALDNLPDEIQGQYQKFQRLEEKQAFRDKIKNAIGEQGFKEFEAIRNLLMVDGVVMFRDFLESEKFSKLREAYDKKMQQQAAQSTIAHNFLSFKEHLDFLRDEQFKDAFFSSFIDVVNFI